MLENIEVRDLWLNYSVERIHSRLRFLVLIILVFSCSLWWQEELSGTIRLILVLLSVILLIIFTSKSRIHFNKQTNNVSTNNVNDY